MTAGEPLEDDGNGSPARGPETEAEIIKMHAHTSGERGVIPEAIAVKGTRAEIGLPAKVEKSPGDLSQV